MNTCSNLEIFLEIRDESVWQQKTLKPWQKPWKPEDRPTHELILLFLTSSSHEKDLIFWQFLREKPEHSHPWEIA
jgi:hypothetical protein